MFWCLLISLPLLVLSDEYSGDICYPSVLIHQEGHLPSTGPFCVVRKNDHDDGASPIENAEQWRDLLTRQGDPLDEHPNNQIEGGGGNESEEDGGLLLSSEDASGSLFPTPFLLPTSFLSPYCSSSPSQRIRVGESLSTSCVPRFTTFSGEECRSSFFNARQLLSLFFSVSGSTNSTPVPVNTSGVAVAAIGWRPGQCLNLLQHASLVVILNGSSIVSVRAEDLRYINVAVNNHSRFEHRISISFHSATSELAPGVSGLQPGDDILTEWRRPFLIPEGTNCQGRGLPVRFNFSIQTMCSMRRGLQLLASSPSSPRPFSSPLDLMPFAFLSLTSTTVAEFVRDPIDSVAAGGCELLSGVSLTLAYSLKGPSSHPIRLLSSAVVLEEHIAVPPITANSSFVFSFALRFVDVTTDPKRVFVSPPRLDLRLPSDFFYPFLVNYTRHLLNSLYITITIIPLLLLYS